MLKHEMPAEARNEAQRRYAKEKSRLQNPLGLCVGCASPDGTLLELWIMSDDPSTLEAVQEIIRRYEEVRRYDDPLTYSRKRRETIYR